MTTLEAYGRYATSKLKAAEKFKQAKIEDINRGILGHVLVWGESLYSAQAEVEVFGEICEWVEYYKTDAATDGADKAWDDLVKQIQRTSLRLSTNVPSSSSWASNMMDNYKRAVWATALEYAVGRR